jgi:hypothetical protein
MKKNISKFLHKTIKAAGFTEDKVWLLFNVKGK